MYFDKQINIYILRNKCLKNKLYLEIQTCFIILNLMSISVKVISNSTLGTNHFYRFLLQQTSGESGIPP